MTTEPNYTDAQIEAQCTRLKQLEQMGDSFRVTHSEFRSLHDMLRSLLSERQAAMQGQGGEVVGTEDARERVMEAIAGALGDAFDCTRVWSAWSYGTMSEDDFSLVREDEERLGEIADAAIAALQPPQPVRSVSEEDCRAALTVLGISPKHNGDIMAIGMKEIRPVLEHFAAIAQDKPHD